MNCSEEFKDFINLLLKKNPEERLGTKNGIDDIKNHPWFTEFDWNALEN